MKEKLDNIDHILMTEGQQVIAKAVASLPDETLSLVWRSELNEVLREKAVSVKRRKVFFNFLSPVAGLGVACALAMIVLVRPNTQVVVPSQPIPASQTSLEASLVQLHQDDLRNEDVAGTGLNPTEAINDVSPSPAKGFDNSEDDFDF